MPLVHIEADSLPEHHVHGGRVGEPDHGLDDEVGPFVGRSDPVQAEGVVDGGVPRADGTHVGLQHGDDGQVEELAAVLLGKDGVVAEHRDLASFGVTLKKEF